MLKTACSPATPRAPRRSGPTLFGNGHRHRLSHYLGNAEPDLSEMLDDEVIRRLMARDGVQPELLLALAGRMRDAAA
jgi:hypothetical protein